MGVTVWGDQRVWKPQEGRGHGRGGRRTARRRRRSIGQAVERFVVTIGWWVRIKVEYSEPDTCFCQISSDGHFYGRQPFVGKSVRSGDDGQDINSGREGANYVDLRLRKNRSTEERISGDRGLEDDRFGIGLRDTVGVRAWKERGRWTDSRRRNDSIRIQEIYAPIREKRDSECMGKGQNGDARGRGLATYKWMWWSPVLALYSYKGGQSERTCRDKV